MLRVLLVLSWAAMIFVLTSTASVERLVKTGEYQFVWNSSPNLMEILSPLPDIISSSFMLQKIGHAFVFFIFTMLLSLICRSLLLNLAVSFWFAFTTELLQLFFTRHGRLFDIAFDGIGIVTALVILGLGTLYNSSRHTKIGNSL